MSGATTPLNAIDAIMLVRCKLHGLAAIASIGELDHSGLEGLDVLFCSLADELKNVSDALDKKN